ncbi:hypothetical protein QW71_27960 [Paenibacillus sp. IHB B 3415]|uniref:hypothetical protein n=1 Tax=Paenibacillus sp. IHB B 3415 TaxID=867080 RepID=UPI000575C5F8|nr:hypothetical protein [Paenibacillus sp. IHB B 3415]KHL92664.1 hypothetical protein QW71_27960 [Paenibacillus sp. IHB B 3415]
MLSKFRTSVPRFFLVLTLFIFAFYFFNKLSWRAMPNSDYASIILEAQSFLKGNFILKNWSLTNISFYTTDLPFYVIAMFFEGFTPKLMHHVPALIYTLILVPTFFLTNFSKLRHVSNWSGIIFVFVIICFPSIFYINNALVGPIHIGTLLYLLIAFVCLEKYLENDEKNAFSLYVFFAFLLLAFIGDSLAYYIGAIPIIVVSSYFIFLKKMYIKKHITLIMNVIMAVVVSKGFSFLISYLNGFEIFDTNMRFTTYDKVDNNLSLAVEGLIKLLGADIFNHPLSLTSLLTLAHLFVALFVLMLPLSCLKNCKNYLESHDYISLLLSASMYILIIAFILSNMAIDINSTRYLVAFVLFGAIVIGRSTYSQLRIFKISLPILILIYAVSTTQILRSEIPISSQAKLSEFLIANNLNYGYSSFWASNIVTVESNDRVKVRAISEVEGELRPFNWFSEQNWYKENTTFLILNAVGSNLTYNTAVNQFGIPNQNLSFEEYDILVWNYNISTKLMPKP